MSDATGRWRGPVEEGRTAVQRRPLPVRWRIAIGLTVVVALIAGIAVPALALLTGRDLTEKAAIVQASTSWLAAVLAVAASVVAVLAYRNSVQEPDLALSVRNSLNTVVLTLRNDGSVSARWPIVRVRFQGHEYDPGNAPQWRPDDFTGDGMFATLIWVDPAVTLHPGLDHDLPYISFDVDYRTGQTDFEVRASVEWTSERARMKVKSVVLRFPSAR